MIKPGRLRPNGVIGVVSPAGVVDAEELRKGIARLEGLGFKLRLGESVLRRHRYLAGSDQERAEDIHRIYADPEVEAVFCTRGGSGTGRLIPLLDAGLIARNPKIFVGSSDITTLLLYLQECGDQVVFHGPMIAPNFGRRPSPQTEEALLKVLAGERPAFREPGVTPLREGSAEGVLTGGCLTLLCTSIGTAYEVRTEERILFIEETDEAPYRVDRMLSYLKSVGKFERVRGVVFGEMTRCQFPKGTKDRLEEVILEILSGYDFPVLFGFPSGHGEINLPLPFGVPVRIDSEDKALTLLDSAVS
jgi:muramoyltetrapeptide carboxypeptidase